jgi:F-type H+-transporting ATPase subunit b
MQINWFTVIAQVINFLVLVWLLKKFLYKPILKAVDDREKKIASEIKDANHLKAEAKKEQDDFTKKNADFDQQKKGLMDKAVADVAAMRQQLLDEAKDAANKLSTKIEAASTEKQQTEQAEIAQKTQKEVFAIARKALTLIASESLEEQSVGTFIKRLNDLKDDEKKKFIEAFKSNANLPAGRQVPILVSSAFDLPLKQQQDISIAVDAILETHTTLQFKTTPGIITGIELTTNGYKLAWSFSEYLNSLEKNISETMNEKMKADDEEKATPVKKAAPEKEADPVKN